MVSCFHCGEEIRENHEYCSKCQQRMDPSSDKSTSSFMKKKQMPFWFKLLALLAISALSVVTIGILFTESWVDVIDNHLQALREQDVITAYHAFTSQDFQATTSLDQFRLFIEANPALFQNQSSHFNERSIDENKRTLRGHLTSQDHILTPIEYKLIKEDGKWKIFSIQTLSSN